MSKQILLLSLLLLTNESTKCSEEVVDQEDINYAKLLNDQLQNDQSLNDQLLNDQFLNNDDYLADTDNYDPFANFSPFQDEESPFLPNENIDEKPEVTE